jgi:hypothetical protein
MSNSDSAPYRMSDRQLRRILKRVDQQRVVGISSSEQAEVRPWPIIERGLPHEDEAFSCGLLTCELRGWIERFGDEMPMINAGTGRTVWGNQFRITQAGRAVLDRTQMISNIALLAAIVSLLASIILPWIATHSR